ncbi:Kinesin-like protein [Dirofilaria immitis]
MSCNPLMPDQSVISIFDNSKNKPIYSTSTSIYGKNIDIVEEWDSITPSPFKVIGTVIRAPNVIQEVEEKVTSIVKESNVMYSSGNNGKDKLYMHEVEEPEESDSVSSFKRDKISKISDEMTLNYKTPTENKSNSSTHYFLSTNLTVTSESTISTFNTMNDTFKKTQNKLGREKFVSDLRIIDIMEIFNILVTLIAPTSSSEMASTTHYSSVLNNTAFRSMKDEFFDEVDTESIADFTGKTFDKAFSQMHQNDNDGEVEINHIKENGELTNEKHSGDNTNIADYAAAKSDEDYEKFEKNSKLNPQVIPRLEFAKNGINEQENGITNDCNINHIDNSKEDSEQRKISKDKAELWESRNEVHEKDDKIPVSVHFEKTLWEKLVAGLKCSQRDCSDALKPTESVRRYLIQPSISRARKHNSGRYLYVIKDLTDE